MFRYRVVFLDDTYIERDLEKNAVGKVLFDQVCEHLNLLERDYFGLAAWETSSSKVWLDYSKEVHKQIIGHDPTFTLNVKFYPPDPSVLAEDISRYLLCQQIRMDIMTRRLPCPSDMLAVLGSYTVQSEFGYYDPDLHEEGYLSNVPLAPSQTPELEDKVAELHRTYKSMSPAQADELFLENAKTLPMYGVDLHPAQDVSGEDVMLGVCPDGLMVYDGKVKTQSFLWPGILKISYKRSKFYLRVRDSQSTSESSFTFILPNYRMCKRLWKTAVEHHAFFRNHRQGRFTEGLQQLWSRFRFHGKTHTESVEASSNINRSAPRFSRSGVKRKAKENLLRNLKCKNRMELDDWVQVLDFDRSLPTYLPDTTTAALQAYKQAEAKKFKYAEKDEANEEAEEPKESEEDKEWFELLAGRSLLTLFSHPPEAVTSESAVPQLWKQYADDWFDLLHSDSSQLSILLKSIPSFPKVSEVAKQTEKEEIEWEERTTEGTVKIVKIRKEVQFASEGPVSLDAEARMKRHVMSIIEEKLEEEETEEKIQKIVINEQRIQEVEVNKEQSLEGFVERRIMRVEVKEGIREEVVEESQMTGLQKRLLEVQAVEQRLQDVEGLKVRLQEVDILEQKLEEAEHKGRQYGEADDWQVLLDRQPPVVLSKGHIVRTAKQRAQMKEWEDEVHRKAEALTAAQFMDVWYILLDSLPPTGDMQLEPPVEEPHEEEEYRKWVEEQRVREEIRRASQVMEIVQAPLPVHREAESQDWFVLLDYSPKDEDHFEQVEQKAGLMRTITIKEEEMEEMEESMDSEVIMEVPVPPEEAESWFVLLDPLPFSKRCVPLENIEDRIVKEEEIRRAREEERKRQEKIQVVVQVEERTTEKIAEERAAGNEIEVEDNWFVLLDYTPKETVEEILVGGDTRAQRSVTIVSEKVTIEEIAEEKEDEEVEKKIPIVLHGIDDTWFIFLDPTPYEKRSVPTHVVDTWVLKERREREARERRMQEEDRRRREAEEQRRNLGEREPEIEPGDEWFILLEPRRKGPVRPPGDIVERRAEEEQRRREEQRKKEVMVEEEKKKAVVVEEEKKKAVVVEEEKKKAVVVEEREVQPPQGLMDDWLSFMEASAKKRDFKPSPVPVISPVAVTTVRPQPPADQPMTSTPTTRPFPITRPTYQEVKLQRMDITQEIEMEDESVLMRKRRERRPEGESIYIRHSLLMLEDLDVTQEVVLQHYASVRELKRLFMEDIPVVGPTEWDKRLSTHSPVRIPQLTEQEEIVITMETMEEERTSAL